MKTTERKLRKVIRTEIKKVLNEHTDTPEWKRLNKALDKATKEAIKFGQHVKSDRDAAADNYDDRTGDMFVERLKRMYNAFMTGDPNARRSDEVFK